MVSPMKIRNLKVRPKREVLANPCGPEFAAMLQCWASTGDLSSTTQCSAAAKLLQDCMKQQANKGPRAKPTINYHLAKWSKRI